MKNVMVLYSGGLDSTYLIWKNIMDGNNVYPIYVEIKNNHIKTFVENKQSAEILEILNDMAVARGLKRMFLETTVSINVYSSVSDDLHLLQLPIWLTGIMYSGKLSHVDEIQIGYVMNDDAISYLDDIKNLYESYKPFVYSHPKLVFPLTKEKKTSMHHDLPESIKKLIISCEMPILFGKNDKEIHEITEPTKILTYKTCGECVPCKRQKELGIYDYSKDYAEMHMESKMLEKAVNLPTKVYAAKTISKRNLKTVTKTKK